MDTTTRLGMGMFDITTPVVPVNLEKLEAEAEADAREVREAHEAGLALLESLINEVKSYDPKYSFEKIYENFKEDKMRFMESRSRETHFEPMFHFKDYTQDKEATPAELKEDKVIFVKFDIENESARQVKSYGPKYSFEHVDEETSPAELKEDELTLIEYNIGNESARHLVHTPSKYPGKSKYRGKSKYPALTGQPEVEFNIENESASDLALTPGKYPGKSKYRGLSGQLDSDLSSLMIE